MALTYRTPMEDIVSSFEPAVQSSIASKAALGYKHLEEENFQIANYHLKPEAKLRLSSAGIYLSPFSAVVHSHPVCKTLENYILYTVLPNYVNNKFYFVGIKNSKLHLLKSRNPHLELVQLINRYVTSKDKTRYSNDFVMRSSAPVAGLCRHKAVLADVTLKDLVPNILNIKSKHLFLHDELHYWREKDLITFLEAVQPETLLGTVVFPPELLIGAKTSLNPWCYQFEIQDGNLLFFPDGERTEGYEQPLRGGYLLTTNEIHLPNGEIYCVDLLCSKFAHHLFSITRGSAITCKYRSFGRFEAVSFAGLLDLSPLNQPYLQVSFDVVSKLYRYLRSLKKPDLQSAMAKLSQIVPEPTSEEIKFTQEFAELVINSQTMNSIISVNRLQTFITRLYRKILPKWCLDKMACVRNLCLDDFISALRPLSVTKKLKRVDLSTTFDMNDWTDIQCEEAYNLIDRLDDGFIGPNLNASSEFASPSLRAQPYVGLAPLTDLPKAPLLIIPDKNLIVILSKRVLQAVSPSEVWRMKLIDLKMELEKVLSRRNLIIPIEHCLKDQMLKAVLSRIRALTVKYNKTPFVNNHCNWFTCGVSHRVNQLFLTNFEEQPAVSPQLKRNWDLVCQDILHQSLSLCGSKLPFFKRAPSKVVSSPVEEEVSPTLIQATKEILGEFNLGDLSPKTVLEILRESGQSKLAQDGVETESSESLNISITGSANEGLAVFSEPIETPANEECGPILIRTCYDGRVRKHFNLLFEVKSAVEAICLKLGLLEKEVVKLLGSIEYNAAELFPQNEHVLIDLLAAAQKRFRTDLYLIFESSDEKYSIIGVNKRKDISYEATLMLFVATSEVIWVVSPKNLCVVDAIASALGREVEDVLRVLNQKHYRDVLQSLLSGQGLDVSNLNNLFKIFSIRAEVEHEGQTLSFNDEGTCCGFFKLIDDHLEFVSDKKSKVGSLLTSGRVTQRDFESSVLLEVGKIGSCIAFTPKFSRAKLLADCLHTGNTGVITSELFNGKANLSEAFNQNFIRDQGSKQVYAVLGTFGVGKSSVFRRLTSQARGQCFDFVSPRKALLNEIREEVGYAESKEERRRRGQMAWSFSTFEKFLSRVQCLRQNQVVFLDEVQLYPNGYLDLIFALAKVDFNLIVFGDPCQSDYDNERDRSYLSNITCNIDSLLKGKEYKYNILSYRFENPNFVGRLPCSFAETRLNKDAQPYLMYNDLEQLEVIPFEYTRVVLVSSFEEKRIVSSYCPSVGIVLTFGESTGLNFDFGTILITLISERTSEKRWVTALSRFKKNLAFVNATGYSMEGLATSYKTRFLGRFLTGTADVDDLKGFLPGSPVFIDGFSREIGKNEGIREEKLIGDPWLKCMIDLFQLEDLEVVEAQEIQIQSEDFKIHLPREELEGTRARWVHRILNKEFREVRLGSIVSDQFTDDHSKQKGGMQLTNAAERFETIYPRHRANDTVTFIMAVKKRLRFSKPHLETAKLNHAKPFGRYLLNEFLKKVPLKRAYDVPMMEEARQDFFDKKTSKSAATIENHNVRSCRDWLADIVQVFSKSQICTKFDNRFRSAKAAQSIACFQHSVLCRFAPYMRYIEKKLHEALPEKFYIHSGKSLEQLNDWVIRGKFDGVCTESDYEAFDASQDQYIVAFELEVMKHLGLPNDLIKDYIYIKTHLGSKLGNFAIMRFTGEASTFLFNTMANMLFTFLRYNLHGDERICFAGDDMCSSKRLRISNSHEGFLSKIKLKAKVQHTNKPTFCGWHLCPDGIYKKPQLVFERMCIAKETNNLQNCIDSYAIEVSYAYKMGERVFSRMDEEEIGAYYGCVRTIIKYKHLLKSEVRALYESLE